MRGRKPFILTEQERPALRKKVLSALKPGKKTAITGKELARLCNRADDRLIRVVIKELVKEGIPIASSVGEPGGYFIVQTPDEAYEHLRILRGRRDEIDADIKNFEIATKMMELPQQLSLTSVAQKDG